MPITERTLRKWRKEALEQVGDRPLEGTIDSTITHQWKCELSTRILRMTQELLDQCLLRKK